MKRKFNFIIFLIISFVISSNAHSLDSKCTVLMDNIKNNTLGLEIDELDYWVTELQNLSFDTVYSDEMEDWVYLRDKNNNLELGKVHDFDKFPNNVKDITYSLFPGDTLISINDESVSKLSDEKIDKLLEPFYNMDQELGSKIKFIFLNKYGKEITTYGKIIENDGLASADVSLRIKNISEINVKKNTFETDISIKVSWNKNNLYDYSVEPLINDRDKGEYWYCKFTPSEFEQMQIGEVYFQPINSVKLNENLIQDNYTFLISDYLYDFGIYERSEENFVNITHEKSGNFTFSNEFNLRAFPFDRQKLIIQIADITRSAYMLDLVTDNYSHFELSEFEKEGNILEWKIVGTQLKYFYEDDPVSLDYSQGVAIQIDIERNFQYYIFKIICPIILILLVSWSVFWIHPKELESKLTITIVCLLSLIAYNFVIDNDLPKLSYLTIIDYIVLLSYAFATLPNFISIYSYSSFQKKNKKWVRVDANARIFGPLIYVSLVVMIILINSLNNDYTAAFLGFLR